MIEEDANLFQLGSQLFARDLPARARALQPRACRSEINDAGFCPLFIFTQSSPSPVGVRQIYINKSLISGLFQIAPTSENVGRLRARRRLPQIRRPVIAGYEQTKI